MTTAPDATPEGAKGYRALRSNVIDFASLFNTAVERVVEIQRSAIDLAAKQTTETLQTCKKALPSKAPGLFAFDLAEQTFQHLADTQKKVLHLVVEQSHAVLEATKRNSESVTTIAEDLTTEIKNSMQRVLAAQKKILEFASQQNKAVAETVKEQTTALGEPAAAVTESMQKGVEALIDNQKELLDNQDKLLDDATKSLQVAAGE